MIEKNALPGAEEYFQHMVRALNVECEDLNSRQGGASGGGGAKGAKAGGAGSGGGGEPTVKKAKANAVGAAGGTPNGAAMAGRRPGSGRGELGEADQSDDLI